jgi:hypothetical protein
VVCLLTGESLGYTLTITNTGNIDFTDIAVPVTGGNGGQISSPICKRNDEPAFVGITGILEVNTVLACTVSYTIIQEDLEVGNVTLSASGTSTIVDTSSPSEVTTQANQILRIKVDDLVQLITDGKEKYNAVGKYR